MLSRSTLVRLGNRIQPNIAAAHGLGPAWAAPQVLSVLCALGLVDAGQWTATAEPVLWREEPQEWRLDIAADPRFRQALDRAVNEMPEDIRRKLDRMVTITEADVTEGLIRREAHQEGLRAEHRANRVICLPLSRDSVRQGLIFLRIHDLDWLFFSNWRLSDGWLSPLERKRALEIFRDSLAIRMRRAVVRRLYPDRLEFSG